MTVASIAGRQKLTDSLIERSLGRFGGWQMTPGQEARGEVELRSSTGAVISRARGAPLGAVEADLLTWLLAQWVSGGSPVDGGVRTTLHQLVGALYGAGTKGTRQRELVVEALINLHMASVTLSDYDTTSAAELPGRYVDVHLVKRIHYGEQLQALRDRQEVSAAELGALRGETLTIFIDDWLIGRLQHDALRAWLDWPVQRSLGAGIAKRLWLYLEPHPGFRLVPGQSDLEGAILTLTDDVYAELGARCRERRDNRKTIRRGSARIAELDPRYVKLEFRPGSGDDPDRLCVFRRPRGASSPAASQAAAA